MYCANCGKELGEGKFCPDCGTAVQSKAVEQKPNETKTSVDNREGKVSEGKNITLSLPSKDTISKINFLKLASYIYLISVLFLLFFKVVSIEISSKVYSVGILDIFSKRTFELFDTLDRLGANFIDFIFGSELILLIGAVIAGLVLFIFIYFIVFLSDLIKNKISHVPVHVAIFPIIYSCIIIVLLWYVDIRISVELSQSGFITEYFSSYFSIKAATPIWIMLIMSVVMFFLVKILKIEEINVTKSVNSFDQTDFPKKSEEVKIEHKEFWNCPYCGNLNNGMDTICVKCRRGRR